MVSLIKDVNVFSYYLVSVLAFCFVAFLIWKSVRMRSQKFGAIVVVYSLVIVGLIVFRSEVLRLNFEYPNIMFWVALVVISPLVISMMYIFVKEAAKYKERKAEGQQRVIRTSLMNGSE